MYTCLNCGEQGTRRVEGRYCPNEDCWAEIENYTAKDGTKLWVPLGDSTPPKQMLEVWFDAMSARLTKDKGVRINFTIHPMRQKMQYLAELAMAGNLLMIAEWNIDLAKEALKRVVINPKRRAPNTLSWVNADYNEQLLVVKAEREAEKVMTSEDYTKQQVENMEDVWE